MEAADVIKLYELGREHGLTTWIDGGWGVDALLGYQSRPHKDLDIAIQEKDVPKLRALLQAKGYREIKLDSALTEKDFRDVAALCEKFGIKLPAEYLKFKTHRAPL